MSTQGCPCRQHLVGKYRAKQVKPSFVAHSECHYHPAKPGNTCRRRQAPRRVRRGGRLRVLGQPVRRDLRITRGDLTSAVYSSRPSCRRNRTVPNRSEIHHVPSKQPRSIPPRRPHPGPATFRWSAGLSHQLKASSVTGSGKAVLEITSRTCGIAIATPIAACVRGSLHS